MKTNELIRLLQEEDPGGECEVNVNGKDIYFVEKVPGYYDGAYKVLVRDPANRPYYDINGIHITTQDWKVILRTMGIDDVLLDDPDAPVTYDNYITKGRWEKSVEDIRTENRSIIESVNSEMDKKKDG